MGIFDKAKKAINDNADKVDKVQDTIKGKTGNL